jgi:hypothetical protein
MGEGGAHRKHDDVEVDVAEKGQAALPIKRHRSIRDDWEDKVFFDARERVHEAYIKEEASAWRKSFLWGGKTSATKGTKLTLTTYVCV